MNTQNAISTQKLLVIGLIVVLMVSGITEAQMTLVSSDPVEGSLSVATNATLSLTFNKAIDTSVIFDAQGNDFFLSIQMYPQGAYQEPDNITLSPDLKTVHFQNFHLQPNTQYLAILTGAQSTDGFMLDRPYVLNFTTGTALPTNTVSGKITYSAGSPLNTFVGLMQMGPAGRSIRACTVVQLANGNYTMSYVQPGTYNGVAIMDSNSDGVLDPFSGDVIGFYDPNLDGIVDDIMVAGNLNGINIALGISNMTSFTPLAQTDVSAQAWEADAALLFAGSNLVDQNGTSTTWGYGYISYDANQILKLFVIGPFIMFGDIEASDKDFLFLPDGCMESDAAVALAQTNGGSAFCSAHADWEILAYVLPTDYIEYLFFGKPIHGSASPLKNLPIKKPAFTADALAVWVVNYTSENDQAEHTVWLDAQTGAVVVEVEQNKEDNVPCMLEILQNYPNPFNAETTITYQINQPGEMTLEVYNHLGQIVRTLIKENKTPGIYKVQWNGRDNSGSDVPSGLYIYKIQTKYEMDVKKGLLIK